MQFGIPFEPNIENQPQNVPAGTGGTSGQIDLFVPDFKMPQRLKYAIGFDKVLDSGWKFTFDGLFTDNLQGFAYENLNIGNAIGRLNGADNRPYYNRRATLDPTYDRIPLVFNTSEGYSYNLGLQIAKDFNNGLDFSATYHSLLLFGQMGLFLQSQPEIVKLEGVHQFFPCQHLYFL